MHVPGALILLCICKALLAIAAGPACAGSATWWNNARGQTPCDVYQDLLAICDPSYVVRPIKSGSVYVPAGEVEACACNTIAYNLCSACADCQHDSTTGGPSYASFYLTRGDGCKSSTNGSLPASIGQVNLDIPSWAMLDTSGSYWDYSVARDIAEQESPPPSSAPPTSSSTARSLSSSPSQTSATASGTAPAPGVTNSGRPSSSSSASPDNASAGPNVVAIATGTVAGVLFMVVLTLLAFIFLRKRKRQEIDLLESPPMGRIVKSFGPPTGAAPMRGGTLWGNGPARMAPVQYSPFGSLPASGITFPPSNLQTYAHFNSQSSVPTLFVSTTAQSLPTRNSTAKSPIGENPSSGYQHSTGSPTSTASHHPDLPITQSEPHSSPGAHGLPSRLTMRSQVTQYEEGPPPYDLSGQRGEESGRQPWSLPQKQLF